MRDQAVAQALGRRVRRRRQANGLTLRDVEQRSGVSATHISEVERGKTSPTVGVLERISSALGVRPGELLDAPGAVPPLLQAPAERRKRVFADGASLEGLTHAHGPCEFSACLVELPAGARFQSEDPHPGEELCYVISGALEIQLGDVAHVLHAREAIHFRPSVPHTIANAAGSAARMVWVSRPRAAL